MPCVPSPPTSPPVQKVSRADPQPQWVHHHKPAVEALPDVQQVQPAQIAAALKEHLRRTHHWLWRANAPRQLVLAAQAQKDLRGPDPPATIRQACDEAPGSLPACWTPSEKLHRCICMMIRNPSIDTRGHQDHLPMQKREKIRSNTDSVSCSPVISPKLRIA